MSGIKIKVKSRCRDCNGEGYYCDYRCAANPSRTCTHRCRNVCDCEYNDGEPTQKEYEVVIHEKWSNMIERQINHDSWKKEKESWEVEA